jgi:tRNA A-37 threonylcarbamoyl transferase component Bud32/WD40 repeat protein
MTDGSDEPDKGSDIGFAPTLDGHPTELDDGRVGEGDADAAHPTPASSRECHDDAGARGRGDILEGVYEVIDVLSEAGGMARVFLARDLRLGRQVVVKMTRSSSFDAEKRALFEREARATARLKHRNIVTIHAFGFWGNSPYMVLEYLEGQSLRERLEAGQMVEADAIRTMIPLARALEHAHQRGVFHRDIKPDNIFLEESGEVKLLDFGISDFNLDKQAVREALESGAQELLDGTPAVAGTPGFMAPEQWRGQSQDARTDVWGIGATLYSMLSGDCPYPPNVPTRLFTEGIPSVGEVRPDLHDDTVELIDRCLNVEPSERFASAQSLLAALEATRDSVTSRGEISGSPYRYLQPFEEGEGGWFFGRDAETARLARLVDANPLTALIGPSGAGKSSLVRAGLLPKLRERGATHVLHVRPENRPLERLRTELEAFADLEVNHEEPSLLREPGLAGRLLRARARGDNSQVILLVDQLEELFTGEVEEPRRQAFVDAICSASDDRRSRVRVVVTMREDFLSRLATYPTLQRRVTENLLLLGAPDSDDQRDMLVKPAERLGFEWPEAVVRRVLGEVADDPTPLPSLQIAASRLWELRDEDAQRIPPDALDRIGGVAGALSSHADQIVDRLQNPAALHIAREIFCILVGREETRRAMPREDLLDRFFNRETAESVLEHLIAGRLIAISSFEGETTVELAHDALIDRWDRLENWLHDDAESRRLRERLAEAARHWDTEGRPSELLWEGETLRRTLAWEDADARDLSVVEHDFLGDSRQAIDRRTWMRRYAFIAAFALVAGAFYFVGARGDDQSPDYSEEYLVAAAQLLPTEPDLAVPFALGAADRKPSANAATLLHEALQRSRLVQRHPAQTGVRDAVFSSASNAYLTIPNSGFSLAFRDLDEGENNPLGVQGKLGAATTFDAVGTLFHQRNDVVKGIWCEKRDALHRGALGRVWTGRGRCTFPATSPNLRQVKLVRVGDGEVEETAIGGVWTEIERVSLGDRGRRLLIIGERGPKDTDSGQAERTIEVFTSDGDTILELTAPPRFELVRLLPSDETSVLMVTESEDGRSALATLQPTVEQDPVSLTLDMAADDLDADVSPDGTRIAVRNARGQARVVSRRDGVLSVTRPYDDVSDARFTRNGALVLVSDTRVDVLQTDGESHTIRLDAPVHGWREARSGKRLVVWTAARAHLWSEDGVELAVTTAGDRIRGIATRDQGRRLLVVTDAGVELHALWGRPEGVLMRLPEPISHFAFTRDSTRIAASDRSGTVQSIRLDGADTLSDHSEDRILSLRPVNETLELLTRVEGGISVVDGDDARHYRVPNDFSVDLAGWDLSEKYVWATGEPSYLAVWNAETGERTVFRLENPVADVRLDGNSGWFFLVTDDDRGRVGSINGALNPAITWKGRYQDLIFEDTGMCVGSIDKDGSALLTRFGEVQSEIELDTDGVRDLAFAPDGRGIVTIDRAGRVVLWSVEGQRVRELGRAPGAETIEFSPGGKLVAATRPGATWVWNTRTAAEIARLPAGTTELTYDHFSPDQRFIALPDTTGGLSLYAVSNALLWDIASDQLVRELSAGDYARFDLPDPVFDKE